MVALVPSDHAWVGRRYVEAQDFADQTLIIHSLPLETVSIHQYVLAPAGVRPRKLTVLPLTEAEVALVKAEMGVTVMARWALKPYLRDRGLKTIRVGAQGLRRTHYLAVRRELGTPGHLKAFLEFLRAEVGTPGEKHRV